METQISLVTLTALLLGSPGPVPLSLFLLGMTFGLRQSVSYLIGILCGLLLVMIIIKGALLGSEVLIGEAMVYAGWLAAAYMSYLAIQMMRVSAGKSNQVKHLPGFWAGLLFNLLNPKAYGAFMAIFAQHAYSSLPTEQVIGLCFLVAFIVDSAWLLVGAKIRQHSSNMSRLTRIRQLGGATILVMVVFSFSEQLTT